MEAPNRTGIVSQLPNLISGFRLGLAFVFPALPSQWHLATVLIAGLSDLLDGLIARRFNLMSWQGGVLDAVADKAFTLSALLTFTAMGRLAWWHVALLLARDLAVGSIALYGTIHREWSGFLQCPSRLPGKATTALVFAFIVALLAWPDAASVLLWLAITASITAAIDYVVVFLRWRANENRAPETDDP